MKWVAYRQVNSSCHDVINALKDEQTQEKHVELDDMKGSADDDEAALEDFARVKEVVGLFAVAQGLAKQKGAAKLSAKAFLEENQIELPPHIVLMLGTD